MKVNFSLIRPAFPIILRLALGWHFLYEGFSKLSGQHWTSRAFLINSKGPFSHFFQSLVDFPGIIPVIDFLNIRGLILIGLGLVLGVLTRYAIISGIILLSLYYLAYPPVIIVNQLLIEIIALVALLYLPRDKYRLDHSLLLMLKNTKSGSTKSGTGNYNINKRREFLKSMSSLPLLGLFGYLFYRDGIQPQPDATSGATYTFGVKSVDKKEINSVKGKLPIGTIKDKKVSRLLLGGNLLGGSGHKHHLKYLGKLGKAYNTKERVFSAIYFAEQLGVNAVTIDSAQLKFVNEYKKQTGGKIQAFVSCPGYGLKIDGVRFWEDKKEFVTKKADILVKALKEDIDRNIDSGADAFFMHGEYSDYLSKNGDPEIIGEIISYAQSKNYIFGIGGHTLSGAMLCEKMGYNPDFYMKTFHHEKYPSATPTEFRDDSGRDIRFKGIKTTPNIFNDNMWCSDANAVSEFMQNVKKPWLAFKILAAGAIQPEDGFQFAFENGADFITVGMYDFQILDNVKTTINCLDNLSNRTRDWHS